MGRGKVTLLTVFLIFFSATLASAQFKFERPITIIVPWAAGGASDQTARVLAGEMEKTLGQKIAVMNQPGGSGSIGQKGVYDAKHDGYTWAGNADGSVVTYQTLGLLDYPSHKDWHHYYAIFTPIVITVPADSKINTVLDLVAEMKKRPGEVKVASAGVGAGGHAAAETFKKATGIEYKHVPYKGGYPAVVATVQGECETVMQLSMEVADMLRAKKLKALAVMSKEPLVISGYGEIPPVMKFIPNHLPLGYLFGLQIPRGIPEAAKKAIDEAFDKACQSESIKRLADQKACKAVNIRDKDADEAIERIGSIVNWMFQEIGMAKKSPAEFGFKKP
ncbi:MAG: Bug family tripartite tricarboxylate transporter substrate binding protein [Thermodesulfobacteriota bacterium]